MKNIVKNIWFILLVAVAACNNRLDEDAKEIVIGFDDTFDATLDTKATAVTEVPSTLYWGATTGTSTESVQWATSSASVTSSKIYTGKYQTYSGTAYNYYVSNSSFTVGGDMTVSGNGTDIVAGRLAASSSATPSVTLNHIFARTGTLTCNTQSGYTISNVSWTIQGYSTINGTAGTYNMKSQSWTAASTKLSSETAITSSSDFYLIPGEYTFKVSYTLTLGDYSKPFTKSGRVTIVAGKINNISCTASGGDAQEIQFSVSVTPWDTSFPAINLTAADFREPLYLPGEFSVSSTKKVKFAKGNLQAVIGTGISDYRATASEWKFAEHQYDIIGNAAGNNSFAVGSTVDLFGWVGESASYDSYGLCTYTNINNVYYGTSDSDPIKTEWGSIPGVINSVGAGWSTLNVTENGYLFNSRPNASSKWGHGSINGINGMIILPDVWTLPANCSFSAGGSVWANAYTLDASGTSNAWVDMEAAGAVFLPAAGYRLGTSVYSVGSNGRYWSRSVCDVYDGYNVDFRSNRLSPQYENRRHYGHSVRLVKEAN